MEKYMWKSIAAVFCCLNFVGCQTMQQQSNKTQGQMERDRVVDNINNGAAAFKVCMSEIVVNQICKRFSEEIVFENADSANKFALLTNNNKPTAEQIELIKEAIPFITKCRAKSIESLTGTPLLTGRLKYFNTLDEMYIKLAKGEISIGAANETKSKAIAQGKIDWANAWNDLDARFREMHDSEVSGRRQAAAAMLPYLMQQQQNQQFQQQMQYQQQMQNIISNRPVMTSPTTTNCSTIGNQINCTTR
jgi:hypothetical protein